MRSIPRLFSLAAAITALWCTTSRAAETVSLASLLEEMQDRERVARFPSPA